MSVYGNHCYHEPLSITNNIAENIQAQLFKLIFKLFNVYECFNYKSKCAPHACLGNFISSKWNYGVLWDTMWVVKTKPESSAR